MKKIVLFLILAAFKTNAQSEKPAITKSEVKPEATENKQAKSAQFVEGTIPTPEEQGYQKRIVDGQEIYYKQEGQLQLEYRPK